MTAIKESEATARRARVGIGISIITFTRGYFSLMYNNNVHAWVLHPTFGVLLIMYARISVAHVEGGYAGN